MDALASPRNSLAALLIIRHRNFKTISFSFSKYSILMEIFNSSNTYLQGYTLHHIL